jgi:hypothetical protein
LSMLPFPTPLLPMKDARKASAPNGVIIERH